MSDYLIEITHKNQKMLLRKIGFSIPETGRHMYFLTNNFQLDARTIADVYKERWKIELFFKELKQSLKIKHFFGDSENAVRIQIFTALTLYLLLAWQKFLSKSGWTVFQIIQLIKSRLLEKINLAELLNPHPPKYENCYENSLLAFVA